MQEVVEVESGEDMLKKAMLRKEEKLQGKGTIHIPNIVLSFFNLKSFR